jgi:hypothetical protein
MHAWLLQYDGHCDDNFFRLKPKTTTTYSTSQLWGGSVNVCPNVRQICPPWYFSLPFLLVCTFTCAVTMLCIPVTQNFLCWIVHFCLLFRFQNVNITQDKLGSTSQVGQHVILDGALCWSVIKQIMPACMARTLTHFVWIKVYTGLHGPWNFTVHQAPSLSLSLCLPPLNVGTSHYSNKPHNKNIPGS